MSIGQISRQARTAQMIIKSTYGQQLNEREVFAINSGEINGLMRFDVIKKKKYFKMVFDVTGFTTLKGFLKEPLTKDAFAGILNGIVTNIKEMSEMFLNANYVLFDINRVMINPSTRKLYFVYIPIQSFETHTDLKDLLKDIISFATFSSYEDNSYVREYINILNEGINFSLFELEEYIRKISAPVDIQRQNKVICPRCNNVIPNGTNYCNACGTKVLGYSQKIEGSFFDPAQGKARTEIQEDYEKQDIRFVGPKAYLISKRTNEKIPINKSRFMLGKDDRYCDYCIRNNTAVSRQHAELVCFNNHYFIIDKNSTNKTFINGHAIPPENQIELESGIQVKVANEEFAFIIE